MSNPVTIPDDTGSSSVPQSETTWSIRKSNSNDGKEDEEDTVSKTTVALGGLRKRKSFALLDGFFQDLETGEHERVTIDITRLPAMLGRSNESDKGNPHFFGLGKKKAISRKHCIIYYRDREGGRAEWDEMADRVVYKDASMVAKESGRPVSKTQPIPNPGMGGTITKGGSDDLPSSGFFVVECLGKNRILVDQKRVDQGDSMVLRPGSALRISSYMLYFMLPKDAVPATHKIEIPLTQEQKDKVAAAKASKKKATAKASKTAAASPSVKKRPVPTLAASAMKKTKKGGGNSAAATLAELEALPVEDLIERMNEAVTKGIWDRKNQFIGGTICYHAVRSAGAAAEIQKKVSEDGGVSRSDIMEWIEQSDQYGAWVQQMLTNMEPRSYQASITKSLLKSGFVRTSGAGRYIKWITPKDLSAKAKHESSSRESSSEASKKKLKLKTINSVPSVDRSEEGGASSEKGDEDEEEEDEDEDVDEGDEGVDEEEDINDENEDENEESNSQNDSEDGDNSEENGNSGDEMSVEENADKDSESD